MSDMNVDGLKIVNFIRELRLSKSLINFSCNFIVAAKMQMLDLFGHAQ